MRSGQVFRNKPHELYLAKIKIAPPPSSETVLAPHDADLISARSGQNSEASWDGLCCCCLHDT
jgi:hypothetical protein